MNVDSGLSDGAPVVVEGPGVAGVAVGKDLEGCGIGSGKDPAEVVDIPSVARIAIVEYLEGGYTDILHYQSIEDHVSRPNHIRKVRVRNWRNVGTGIPRGHRTHMRRRRCRAFCRTVAGSCPWTRCAVAGTTGTVIVAGSITGTVIIASSGLAGTTLAIVIAVIAMAFVGFFVLLVVAPVVSVAFMAVIAFITVTPGTVAATVLFSAVVTFAASAVVVGRDGSYSQ